MFLKKTHEQSNLFYQGSISIRKYMTNNQEKTRNVKLEYGCFIVILALLITTALQVIDVDSTTRIVLYIIGVPIVIALALIGHWIFHHSAKVQFYNQPGIKD
jgi:protein-S-isoprenylcysteine O-methyltransferase Ste14